MVERVWWGTGAGARLARTLLMPLEGMYAGVSAARRALYDAGILRSYDLSLPAVSIGNITVGGTGKTPVAAWMAAMLRQRGAHPAIVLRGYGGDEPLVHSTLNPEIPVVVYRDRVQGVERARSIGADVAVLDDAFQHRRARRDADVVLVSADAWPLVRHLLPAGPLREPLGAVRRASVIVVTRKAVDVARAAAVERELHAIAPAVPTAIIALVPETLRAAGGRATRPISDLAGTEVLAIAAIGNPAAFLRQLVTLGATPRPAIFPDHHAYDATDAVRLAAEAGAAIPVCTLKDAVKLAPLWPREAPPLWYVTQRVLPERGTDALDVIIDRIVALRDARLATAAASRRDDSSHGH